MSREEADAFLDAKPGWIALTTLGPDGFPHTVPLGYFRMGDEVCLGTMEGTRKVRNVDREPRVSLMLETGQAGRELKGLLIQGEAEVVREPGEMLRLKREAARQRGVPEDQMPDRVMDDAVFIRVRRVREISWDYGK